MSLHRSGAAAARRTSQSPAVTEHALASHPLLQIHRAALQPSTKIDKKYQHRVSVTAHSHTHIAADNDKGNEEKESVTRDRAPHSSHARRSTVYSPSLSLISRAYLTMKQRMLEETQLLRSLIASRQRSESMLAYQRQQLFGNPDLHTDSGSGGSNIVDELLGSFSPHLISAHMPYIHSYPTFAFNHHRDRYQPHIAQCYTLNQACQALHRVESAWRKCRSGGLIYAFSVGSGCARLTQSSDTCPDTKMDNGSGLRGMGDKLLYQLQSSNVSNTLVIITVQSSIKESLLMPALLAQRHQTQCRLIVQIARTLMKDHRMCQRAVAENLLSLAANDNELEDWETEFQSAATNTGTFLTQPDTDPCADSERGNDSDSPRIVVKPATTLSMDSLPSIIQTSLSNLSQYRNLPVTHRHCAVRTVSAIGDRKSQGLLPSIHQPSVNVYHWDYQSLMDDMLDTLSVTDSADDNRYWLSQSSVLNKVFHSQQVSPLESRMTVTNTNYIEAVNFIAQQRATLTVPVQAVDTFCTVQRSITAIFASKMRSVSQRLPQSAVASLGHSGSDSVLTRLCLISVGLLLGWNDMQWSSIQSVLTGKAAVRPSSILGDFPAESANYELKEKPKQSSLIDGRSDNGVRLIETVSESKPLHHTDTDDGSHYHYYRTDFLAHLLSVPLFELSDATISTVHAILAEPVMIDASLSLSLAVLVEWVVLVLRCNRLWRASLAVFTSEIVEENQPSAGESDSVPITGGDAGNGGDSARGNDRAGGIDTITISESYSRGWTVPAPSR